MIRTPVCDRPEIERPIALVVWALIPHRPRGGRLASKRPLRSGMSPPKPEQIRDRTATIRAETDKPFGLNF
jgi:hypothetical protein